MFKSVKTQDGYGNKQTHYYLTQGDTCKITSTPYQNGEVVTTGITKCVFKLATTDYIAVKGFEEIEMTKPTGSNSYELILSDTQTAKLKPGQYLYEIEYTLTDGSIATPNSWKFDILRQITKSENN